MQLHAIMVRCAEGSSCKAELRASMTALLISLLPCLPLKLPQQRAWAAACCVTALQLGSQQKAQGKTLPRSSHRAFEDAAAYMCESIHQLQAAITVHVSFIQC